MQDIALDTITQDLAVSNFDLGLVVDVDRVVQQIKIRLQFFLGEWFLNTTRGIPYFEQVLIKGADRAIVEGLFREQIESTPNVSAVDELTLAFDGGTRLLTVTFRASTDFGALEQSLALPLEV